MTAVIVPSKFESKLLTVPHHVSGMGKIKATCAVYDLVAKGADKILLTGFCGGISRVKVGDIVTTIGVREWDYNFPKELESELHIIETKPVDGLIKCFMLSQDSFMTHYSGRLNNISYVVDMECYAAAYACQHLNIPFSCVKIISDMVGSNSSKDFLESCVKFAPKLNEVISENLI